MSGTAVEAFVAVCILVAALAVCELIQEIRFHRTMREVRQRMRARYVRFSQVSDRAEFAYPVGAWKIRWSWQKSEMHPWTIRWMRG